MDEQVGGPWADIQEFAPRNWATAATWGRALATYGRCLCIMQQFGVEFLQNALQNALPVKGECGRDKTAARRFRQSADQHLRNCIIQTVQKNRFSAKLKNIFGNGVEWVDLARFLLRWGRNKVAMWRVR